jgi:hypothetical protein
VEVVRTLYFRILRREITVCVVDRDPLKIEFDLRRYIQHALLTSATQNKAFAHVMVPRFIFVDPQSGQKVEKPDLAYMQSIETILSPDDTGLSTREEMAQKFLDAQAAGELVLEEGKPVIASQQDNFLQCFAGEYATLLSHRKVDEDINPEQLTNAFFHKRNNPERLSQYGERIEGMVESIIDNMERLYHYSEDIALDTIVFAIRKRIVHLEEILR